MSIAGRWDVTIETPLGSMAATYAFDTGQGGITGRAESRDEMVPLRDISVDDTPAGQRVTWRQSITRPMRLNLDFDVTVAGDEMRGHSRAGRLPKSSVSGARRR